MTQAPQKTIRGLRGKNHAHGLSGGQDGFALQQQAKQLPQEDGRSGESWQDIRQKNGKSAATTLALPSVGTKNTLTSDVIIIGRRSRIIAIKEAVAIKRLGAITMRATPAF